MNTSVEMDCATQVQVTRSSKWISERFDERGTREEYVCKIDLKCNIVS